MQKIKLNTLDYSILAMLLDRELSGYDLTKNLNYFRKINHPRVYTVLAKLESLAYVSWREVEQTGKPNKKLYTLTESAKEVLHSWASDKKSIRRHKIDEEEMARLLCLRLLDSKTAIQELESKMLQIETILHKVIETLEAKSSFNNINGERHPAQYLVEIMRMHTRFDRTVTDWLISTLKEGKGEPRQSLYEYAKENF